MGKAFPRMENGVVPMHEPYTKSAAPNVVILPLGAKAPIPAAPWLPDGTVVSVFELSTGRDHTAVAVTQAVNAGEQRAWLTMSLDATGKAVGRFRTNPYAALHVAAGYNVFTRVQPGWPDPGDCLAAFVFRYEHRARC